MHASDKEILWLPWLGKGQEQLQKQDNLQTGRKVLFVLALFPLWPKELTGCRDTLNLSLPPPSPGFLVLDLRALCTGQENNHILSFSLEQGSETFLMGS